MVRICIALKSKKETKDCKNKPKLINKTRPCVYPVIEVTELISKFSLNTLPSMNHIARLEKTQANAPSRMPKNIISDKLLNPELSNKGTYKENKLVKTIRNALPDSYLSLVIFCKVSISNLMNSLNCFQTSLNVFKLY